MNVVITAWEYLFASRFDEQQFKHCDSRLMDQQMKIAISTARKLYAKARGDKILSEDLGIVLSSDTGPLESIAAYNSVLKEKGYIGINPSKFPHIMSATTLSRVAIEVRAKGPCVPLLSSSGNKQALLYALEQIAAKRCYAVLFLHMSKENNCFGCFIEDEDLCNKRGLKAKLAINEKGGKV